MEEVQKVLWITNLLTIRVKDFVLQWNLTRSTHLFNIIHQELYITSRQLWAQQVTNVGAKWKIILQQVRSVIIIIRVNIVMNRILVLVKWDILLTHSINTQIQLHVGLIARVILLLLHHSPHQEEKLQYVRPSYPVFFSVTCVVFPVEKRGRSWTVESYCWRCAQAPGTSREGKESFWV